MNLEKVFEAIKKEPDQPTLIVAVLEFECQSYQITVIKGSICHNTYDFK